MSNKLQHVLRWVRNDDEGYERWFASAKIDGENVDFEIETDFNDGDNAPFSNLYMNEAHIDSRHTDVDTLMDLAQAIVDGEEVVTE